MIVNSDSGYGVPPPREKAFCKYVRCHEWVRSAFAVLDLGNRVLSFELKKEKLGKCEILAPAGTKEAFSAAIEAGADAVYVGLKAFNARAYAQNFTLEELNALRALSSQRGVKLFVTLNSIVKENELGNLIDILAALEHIGIDAIIIQDLGTWRIAKKFFPRLRMHASTLMTIHNSLGVETAHRMGFKRVVLAREMTVDEIRECSKAAPIELECFIFGAMCFTYSGLCLFSSLFGGKASTRGRCVQPCRRMYKSRGSKSGAYFSMLDLNALELLHELKEAGISSFKIEGRLRPAYYVYHAVKAARIILDSKPGDSKALEEAKRVADSALGRSSSTGFFLYDRASSPPVRPELPPNTGKFIGKIKNINKDSFLLESSFEISSGDRLRFLSKDRTKQAIVKARAIKKINTGLWEISGDLSQEFGGGLCFLTDRKEGLFKKRDIRPLPIDYKMPQTKAARVKKHLAQTPAKPTKFKEPNIWVRVRSLKDLGVLSSLKDIKGFYLPVSLLKHHKKVPNFSIPVTWYLPPVILEKDVPWYKEALRRLKKAGFRGFQVSNLGALSLFADVKGLKISASYHVNCLNSFSVEALNDLGITGVEFSVETDKANLEAVLKKQLPIPIDIVIYGHLPVFTTRLSKHPRLKSADVVESPRGEEFLWEQRSDVGVLLFKPPFSLINKLGYLKRLPVRRWVIDLSFGTPAWVIRKKGGGKSILRGIRGPHKGFNLDTELL